MNTFVDPKHGEFAPQIIRTIPSIEFFIGKDRNNFTRMETGGLRDRSSLLICDADLTVAMHLCLPYWDKEFFSWVGFVFPSEARWMFESFKKVVISDVTEENFLTSEGLFIQLLDTPHTPQLHSYVVIDHGSWKKVQVCVNTISVAILRYFMTIKTFRFHEGFTAEFRQDLTRSIKKAQGLC